MEDIDLLLLIGKPRKYTSKHFQSFEDLEANYAILHKINFDNRSRDRLMSIVCQYILEPKRNRKSSAKKVLYRIIKSSSGKTTNSTVIGQLFSVYQKFAFDYSADNWKISLFLKDLELENDMISWLLENVHANELIENRVLRYPKRNDLIQQWAIDQIRNHYNENDRKSELIGLAINEDTFTEFLNMPQIKTEELAWGIFYSTATEKYNFLIALLEKDPKCIHIANVALRLRYIDLIEHQKTKMKEFS